MKLILLGGVLLPLFFISCQKNETVNEVVKPEVPVQEATVVGAPPSIAPPAPETSATEQTSKKDDQSLIDRGRVVYMSNCLQCHNKDPNINGSLGPSQVDAPFEVFKVKVLTGRYPETLPAGFTPKRKTKVMRKFPHLEKDVEALFAWIQSQKKK